MTYLYLFLAICGEIVGTSALNATQGFRHWQPLIGVVLGYAVAFIFLALVLRGMPMGIAYAIWSGVGIVFITLIGYLFFDQHPDVPALLGLALIVAGVIVVNLFSKTVIH
ncbi:small multidrug resistance pump [Arboricoccus pini]|uniref:Small multidrug resistance pump n=1 Tax=Arboricoccus pini TaxID=1963835 RepID=A0A212QPN2_9PROT|nr:multidrug efflux SMR transporter [Arboricoccus pini]SNB61382.1 small multidrug resistance pump [Arboricoccus pini]